MRQLGISVYPEHSTKELTYAYVRKAGKLGFKRVFTCFLSVENDKETVIKEFSELCKVVHEAGMIIAADTNPTVFTKLGASPYDLSIFHEIGLDIIRLDGHFGETEDIAITHNPYGIQIEYNASGTIAVENMIACGAEQENMCFCSNFFPQRHTGMGLERYIALTTRYVNAGMRVASFVSSQEPHTFGPWPVYDGLPTLEMHRDLPIDLQLRHLSAMNLAMDYIIGNCYASDDELEALAKTDLTKINMRIELAEGISEQEKEILYWDRHQHRDDCNDLIVRSSWPRIEFAGKPIPPRERKDPMAHRGDVFIVNDRLQHYRGELWIALKDFELSDSYNFVGHLSKNEDILLDWIKPRYAFGFICS